VDRWLDRYPNMMADLAARIPEIGRHDPEKVRRLFIKHQDRILFGTDFQVYEKLILGSSGSGRCPPTRMRQPSSPNIGAGWRRAIAPSPT